MNCNEAQLNLLLKSSGELFGNQHQELDTHLKSCETCARYDTENQKIKDLAIQAMPNDGPSVEIVDNIKEQARVAKRKPLIFRRHIIQWAAAAALVLIVLGNWTFSPNQIAVAEISDMYAVLAIVTDNTYISDDATSEESQESIIPDMETLLLQIEDDSENYELTEEELWAPQPKSPQSYNTRATQQKIYG